MLGAVVGYVLGHYAYELVQPLLAALGWLDAIDAQVAHCARRSPRESPWQAFWLLVLAGFTPIPLKIFTWASGIVGVPMLPFLLSMLIGRGKRVFLVAAGDPRWAASAPKRRCTATSNRSAGSRWRCWSRWGRLAVMAGAGA